MKIIRILSIILLLTSLLSCASRPSYKIVKEVIRDTVIINHETNQYESARVAKLDKYKISASHYPAVGQDERVRFLIFHYTALNNEKSLEVLTKQAVSSHYLVLDDYSDSIYVLVDESKRAWHAGQSYWRGVNNINFSSLGIEIVNLGYTTTYNSSSAGGSAGGAERYFYDYPQFQIDKVATLAKDIIERYNIDPVNVLAHSDIAPQRKHDPGPKFPWKRLYDEYGIGAWYEGVHYNLYYPKFPWGEVDSTSFILSVQNDLNKYGYEIQKTGIWDEQTKKVIAAFQYHFRPEKHDGLMDAQTWAILQALLLKYRS